MTKIQVSWLRGIRGNRMTSSISPAILEEVSTAYATAKSMDRFDVNSTDDRWILTFKGDLQTMLISSFSIMEVIRYQGHCIIPSLREKREFVGDDPAAVAELNTVLAALERTERELRESEARRKDAKERAGELAEDLKKTRTVFGSKTIGNVRRSLESMATAR